MSDLRIIKRTRNNKSTDKISYVIMDYDDNRKQIGKSIKFIKDAKLVKKDLEKKEFRGIVKLGDRHKFKDKFEEFGQYRYADACDETKAITKQGTKNYLSYSRRHIALYFPDVYLDEVDAMVLEQFVVNCLDNKITWKTAKNIIRHIHTSLRWFMVRKYHDNFASALNWKIHKQHHLKPRNRDDEVETKAEVISPEEACRVLDYVAKHRFRSKDDAFAYGIFVILATFGLRPSEIQGLHKSNFNFIERFVFIKGAYLVGEGGYRARTKHESSHRPLDFTERQGKHIEWINNYMLKCNKDNPYFFPASRLGQGGKHQSTSKYKIRKLIYKTYEKVGLAKIEWFNRCNTEQFKVIECRFKGGPAKCWRHYNATALIDNMYKLGLTPNHIKSRLGHSRWQTTQDLYGNHNLLVSNEMRQERAEKVEKALGFNNVEDDDWSENTNGLDKDN